MLTPSREFVEGRLAAVQVLLGVAYRGRPVAGVVGLPFPAGAAPRVLLGVVGGAGGVVEVLGGRGVPERGEAAGGLVLAISTDLGAKEVST